MENITLKGGILTFRRKLKRSETYRFERGKKFTSLHIFRKPQEIIGVSSRTSDGKEVIFLDYDNVQKDLVISDYRAIQQLFNLPPGYLFTTKESTKGGETIGNYHIICLAKQFPKEVVKIMGYTHTDLNYISSPLRNKYRSWVLRISDKKRKSRPKFVQLVGGEKNLSVDVSTAHKEILSRLYSQIKHPNYKTEDLSKKIFIQEYEAS